MSKANPEYPILLVDDEEEFLFSAQFTLNSRGYDNVEVCKDSRGAQKLIEKEKYSVIILDMMMPHVTGMELLELVSKVRPDTPVIMLTAVNEVETAVECMKKGAFDYILKPVDDERFVTSIRHALEIEEFRMENRLLKESILSEKVNNPGAFEHIITNDPKMKSIFKYIEAVGKTALPILIAGETGTGKELFAQAVHKISGRKGEFIAVNVAGLDDNLFSDALFGHVKGSYTGAVSDRKGLIEKAAGGTLFLDEIGDLSMESQVKLLRLLQEKQYYPIGSDVYKTSDARIVVATHRDLKTKMDNDEFRTDLYYRLKSHSLTLPELAQRKGDIPMLVDHFIDKACDELGKESPSVPQQLYTMLANYRFPGNIRELQGMIYDAVTLHDSGALSMESFKSKLGEIQQTFEPAAGDEMIFPGTLPTMKQMENMLVDEALKRADGNQTIASQLLGMTRQALNKRLSRRED